MLGLCGKDLGNTLPDSKILALSKLKAFADNNFIVSQMVQFFYCRVEKIVRKEENAPLLPTMISKCFSPRVVKTPDCFAKG